MTAVPMTPEDAAHARAITWHLAEEDDHDDRDDRSDEQDGRERVPPAAMFAARCCVTSQDPGPLWATKHLHGSPGAGRTSGVSPPP